MRFCLKPLALLALLASLAGCQRVPSKIHYLGKEFTRIAKHDNNNGTQLSVFIPKGETLITATTTLNLISSEALVKRYAVFEGLIEAQMKRLGGEPFEGDKKRYCFKSQQGGRPLLLHSLLYNNGKIAVVLQVVEVLDAKRKNEDAKWLCQNARMILVDLDGLAKQIFG